MKLLAIFALLGCLYYTEAGTKCYTCAYVRASGSGFSSESGEECKEGDDVEDDSDKTNCNSMGCAKYELTFESGSIEYEIILRGCVETFDSGNLKDTCKDADDYFNSAEQDLLATLFLGGASSSDGSGSMAAELTDGTVCGCQDDLCNAATLPAVSVLIQLFAAIVAAVIYY